MKILRKFKIKNHSCCSVCPVVIWLVTGTHSGCSGAGQLWGLHPAPTQCQRSAQRWLVKAKAALSAPPCPPPPPRAGACEGQVRLWAAQCRTNTFFLNLCYRSKHTDVLSFLLTLYCVPASVPRVPRCPSLLF